jgi:hypothetical protein
LQRAVGEAADEWRCVQVLNDRNSKFVHVGLARGN